MSSERKDGVAGVDRMWDSQWVNVVNAPEVLEALRDYRADEAVNIAVKLTEQAMAKNARQLAEQRAELLEALNRAFDLIALVGNPVTAGGVYDKSGAWTFAEALPRDANAKAVSEAFEVIAAAIANATQQRNAQE